MVELTLPAAPHAAAIARRHVRDLALDDETLEVVSLLVTELITNAVRHGRVTDGTMIVVHLGMVGDELVHVDVINEGRPFEPDEAATTSDAGLGLKLVDELADSWGVEGNGATRVWLQVRRSA